MNTNSVPLTAEARQLAMSALGIKIHKAWGSIETGVKATEEVHSQG